MTREIRDAITMGSERGAKRTSSQLGNYPSTCLPETAPLRVAAHNELLDGCGYVCDPKLLKHFKLIKNIPAFD